MILLHVASKPTQKLHSFDHLPSLIIYAEHDEK